MSQDAKFNKVVEIMNRAEMNPQQQENLRVFLFSMIDKLEFDELVELFDSNHEFFDRFAHVFSLKNKFFGEKGSKEDWDYILSKEKGMLGS